MSSPTTRSARCCSSRRCRSCISLPDVSFIKNNIDHYTSATFGCHENYLLNRDAPLTKRNIDTLLTFLAVRILLVGAGRVGMTQAPRRYGKMDASEFVPYQISQRADFIQTDIYEWVQFNRALINARDEPLADYRRFRRLHLLLGDSNLLPFANALKVGSTALMLDLLEADALPDIALYEPVCAMRKLSHQPNGPWKVEMADRTERSALDLLEEFLAAATSGKIELDADGKWTVEAWNFALDKLRHDPQALIGKLDWITKQFLLDSFVEVGGDHLARHLAGKPRPRISLSRSGEVAARRTARHVARCSRACPASPSAISSSSRRRTRAPISAARRCAPSCTKSSPTSSTGTSSTSARASKSISTIPSSTTSARCTPSARRSTSNPQA